MLLSSHADTVKRLRSNLNFLKCLPEQVYQFFSLSNKLLYPLHQIKKLKELRAMLMETDPCVAVTVRKLVMVSLMEIFKDIVPSYRIRPLTETEKNTKVRVELSGRAHPVVELRCGSSLQWSSL